MVDNPFLCAAPDGEARDPAGLVGMLYQRALCDLKNAAELWSSPNERALNAAQLVSHAQAVLKELQASLNFTQGGVLAANLGRLYAHMQFRLAEVVAEQADDPLARAGL